MQELILGCKELIYPVILTYFILQVTSNESNEYIQSLDQTQNQYQCSVVEQKTIPIEKKLALMKFLFQDEGGWSQANINKSPDIPFPGVTVFEVTLSTIIVQCGILVIQTLVVEYIQYVLYAHPFYGDGWLTFILLYLQGLSGTMLGK